MKKTVQRKYFWKWIFSFLPDVLRGVLQKKGSLAKRKRSIIKTNTPVLEGGVLNLSTRIKTLSVCTAPEWNQRRTFAGFALVLFISSFLVMCKQPDGSPPNSSPPVNAELPDIGSQPLGGDWNVNRADSFPVTVTADSTDGGTLSYQWYSNTSENAADGSPLSGKTEATLILAKADYAVDGDYYFYVVVTNTISDNGDDGTKTAAITSNVVRITVLSGTGSIAINSPEDMAKIGVDPAYPLAGTYALMNDITLADFVPIGGAEAPFAGVFDGNGKTITVSSFSTASVSGTEYLGVFAYVKGVSLQAKAEIKNMMVASSVNIDASPEAAEQYAGLVAGYAELALIEDITLSGTFDYTSTKTVHLGGIAGDISKAGTIIKDGNSSLTMNIIPGGGSYAFIGGIAGYFSNGAGIENCHVSGNVTADNVANSVSGQVFVGGITGGSHHDMSTAYHGYIKDSSCTGDILGRARGLWTFAGGIAGTIVGDGDGTLENTTRIERCFATGTVSTAGTNSGWPYVGGIVGYNYYGALVSRCYFTGNVIAAKANDYTGGIAGYNSKQPGHNSRIEDCWSSGTVTGFNNAGGIVGQNQVNTCIRRCYSTAAVSVTNSAGSLSGITGLHASAETDAVTACVALNASITAPAGNNIHRIAGTGAGKLKSNYARAGLTPETTAGTYTAAEGAGAADGEDCEAKPAQAFYAGLGWNFDTIWKMGADGYPILQWQD